MAGNLATEGGLLVFNPQAFTNSAVVKVNGESLFVENIPAKGYAVVMPRTPENSIILGDHTMENKFLRIVFDSQFNLVSVYDKEAKREVIDAAKGAGNSIEIYEDFPRDYDAWEITNYYREKKYLLDDVRSVKPVRDGARAGFAVCRGV